MTQHRHVTIHVLLRFEDAQRESYGRFVAQLRGGMEALLQQFEGAGFVGDITEEEATVRIVYIDNDEGLN